MFNIERQEEIINILIQRKSVTVHTLAELMHISEDFIRRYPDQYVWLYKRFRYIPLDADEALAARYPFYAERVKASFYNSRFRGKKEA